MRDTLTFWSLAVGLVALDFLRREPVKVGTKAGFLGAVIYLALRYLGGVSLMWIVKGVLLGIMLFIVGRISYVGIRVGIALFRHDGGGQSDFRIWLGLLHSPVFWAVFLAAIAIGLWIMRPRTAHTV